MKKLSLPEGRRCRPQLIGTQGLFWFELKKSSLSKGKSCLSQLVGTQGSIWFELRKKFSLFGGRSCWLQLIRTSGSVWFDLKKKFSIWRKKLPIPIGWNTRLALIWFEERSLGSVDLPSTDLNWLEYKTRLDLKEEVRDPLTFYRGATLLLSCNIDPLSFHPSWKFTILLCEEYGFVSIPVWLIIFWWIYLDLIMTYLKGVNPLLDDMDLLLWLVIVSQTS